MKSSRKTTYSLGIYAESLACWYLRAKGYRIIARRYKTPMGEVDVVARRGRTLVFAEIKARQNTANLQEVITTHQQQRISRAAQGFMAHQVRHAHCQPRFDAIFISPRKWPVHVENAW